MTVTEVARNFREVVDDVEFKGEEIVLVRNHHEVAKILPGSAHQNALEAMADLHHTLSDDAAKTWVEDSRRSSSPKARLNQLRNPWGS